MSSSLIFPSPPPPSPGTFVAVGDNNEELPVPDHQSNELPILADDQSRENKGSAPAPTVHIVQPSPPAPPTTGAPLSQQFNNGVERSKSSQMLSLPIESQVFPRKIDGKNNSTSRPVMEMATFQRERSYAISKKDGVTFQKSNQCQRPHIPMPRPPSPPVKMTSSLCANPLNNSGNNNNAHLHARQRMQSPYGPDLVPLAPPSVPYPVLNPTSHSAANPYNIHHPPRPAAPKPEVQVSANVAVQPLQPIVS